MTEDILIETVESDIPGQQRAGYQPPDPIPVMPLFVWPPQPVAFLKFVFGFPGYLWPWPAFFLALTFVSWRFLTPNLVEMKSFAPDWIALIFVRNLALIVLFVGVWHARLYIQKAQATQYKYTTRWLAEDNPKFLFRSQLWDNVFWTLISAVPIWTAYEVFGLWMQANAYVPVINWPEHPIYCALLLLFVPLGLEFHFWVTHRLIHWPPLYRAVHYIHHKNVNIGPWSGLAMHPIEHLLYFSGVIVFWVLPSHPLHCIFVLQNYALGPVLQHNGFDRLVLGSTSLNIDHYMHYLHHKYFEVNYAADSMFPIDKWLGTFHDGSAQGMELMKQRIRRRNASRLGS